MVVAFNYMIVILCKFVHFDLIIAWAKRLKKQDIVMQKDYFSPRNHKTH